MPRRLVRRATLPAVIVGILVVVLTSCPANRDGMPGRLAGAMEDATSAARSGALAIDLWQRGRSTTQLTGVQLSDARDEVVKGYDGIAVLRAEDPRDLARQTLLIRTMTEVIATLNDSNVAVRMPTGDGETADLRAALLRAADTLERDYR
ncbi:hypothetical protein C6A86_016240 [Mycobacterium sp. ITM-2016-00316]|uniref:hypothetical protein n=1 Tax=Mycobacterium sp. ITM-2016-00316 TaxID=2099695 RepID=UPI000CF9C43A|nr:hypothetical protein [Mycobacterium sp. ITM-2016-00316]WNG79836.1 hypothetical protein C6A86_016240 [Mycobacterium sp. ITM-2016-00316]